MKRTGTKAYLIAVIVCLSALLSIQAWADDPFLTYSSSYTEQELDNLLAPIALYADPLLAQMLPAATYPAEIVDAHAWLKSGGALSNIDRQNWDESVKAIAHYPSILKMMADNIDWTADVGDAFLNQPEDVSRAIQRLRWRARDAGNLESASQHTVIIVGDHIEIIPAQPQYIYVPQYDPSIVYVQRWVPGGVPFVTFGHGLAIGGWLTLDFDWGHHHVIYHGWNRPGWVNHARPHVRVKKVYVNRSRPYIRQTWRHDASHGSPERYRAMHGGSSIRRNVRTHEIRGSSTTSPKPLPRVFGPTGDAHSFSNRGRKSRSVVSTPSTKLPQYVGKRPPAPAPGISTQQAPPVKGVSTQPAPKAPGISRGKAAPISSIGKGSSPPRPADKRVQPARTPSVTFGGYRGNNEAKSESLRGKTSRQSSPVVRPSAAPQGRGSTHEVKGGARGGAPAGRDDFKGTLRR